MAADDGDERPVELEESSKIFLEGIVTRLLAIMLLGEMASQQGSNEEAQKFVDRIKNRLISVVETTTSGNSPIDKAYHDFAMESVGTLFDSVRLPKS